MSARLERKQGLIQLERSGPAIAPITFPGPGDIIVTQALQIELAQSGLTGFSFLPVIKHTVVELDWEGWDVTADTPEEWPDGGEPEGYVVGQPHSTAAATTAAADALGILFELRAEGRRRHRARRPAGAHPARDVERHGHLPPAGGRG